MFTHHRSQPEDRLVVASASLAFSFSGERTLPNAAPQERCGAVRVCTYTHTHTHLGGERASRTRHTRTHTRRSRRGVHRNVRESEYMYLRGLHYPLIYLKWFGFGRLRPHAPPPPDQPLPAAAGALTAVMSRPVPSSMARRARPAATAAPATEPHRQKESHKATKRAVGGEGYRTASRGQGPRWSKPRATCNVE
jgi:hypothetical protein